MRPEYNFSGATRGRHFQGGAVHYTPKAKVWYSRNEEKRIVIDSIDIEFRPLAEGKRQGVPRKAEACLYFDDNGYLQHIEIV